MNDKQIDALMKVRNLSKVILDKHGIPIYITGELGSMNPSTLKSDINNFKLNFGDVYRMDQKHDLRMKKVSKDSLGLRHIKLQQYFNGKIVFGGELIVHATASTNKIEPINGR